MSIRASGGGPLHPGSSRGGLSRAFRPSALLLVLLGAVAWTPGPASGATDETSARDAAGDVRALELPEPGQSVPTAGPNLPLLSAAPSSGVGLPSPASRRLAAPRRTGESGDRPGHRLRVERPPRPVG